MEGAAASVIESAAREAEEQHGFSDLGPSLSNATVAELHQIFGSSNDGTADVDPQLWDDVASKRVPLGLVGQGLAGVMDNRAGSAAFMAADVFLGIILAPGCPVYSFFTPLAFLALIRCFKNLCRRSNDDFNNNNNHEQSNRARKGSKKMAASKKGGKQTAYIDNSDNGEDDELNCCDEGGRRQVQKGDSVSLDQLMQILRRVELLLDVLQLKGNPECLKSLVELLAEIPYLLCDLSGGEDPELARASRAKRGGVTKTPVSAPLVPRLCFRMMLKVLQPNHGDTTATGVALLKALSPSIMLTHSGGSTQHRAQIRVAVLEFITKEMIAIKSQSVRRSVVALTRYLSVKAPEKTEARALTVEAILMIVRGLNGREQREFGNFVAKLSLGKPRYRLIAVDLAVSLLGGLPDPLGLNREVEVEREDSSIAEQMDNTDFFQDGNEADALNKETCNGDEDAMLDSAECSDKDIEGSANVNSNANCSKASPHTTKTIWWGERCLEALLHRCSDKVPAIRARALTNMAQAIETLSADMKHRIHLQGLMGFRGAENNMVHGLNAQLSDAEKCFTPGQECPSFGRQTPSPHSNADGLGATPITPGVAHRDLGFLLRRRCMDDKVAVRKAALILMTKTTALLGKPPDETMLQAMGAACSDPMVSIKKAGLLALSEVFRKFPVDRVISEWLQSVLPLVTDNESSIQEECLNLFQELVVERISSVASDKASSKRTHFSDPSLLQGQNQEMEMLFPQGVLHLLKGLTDGNIASCVKRICMLLGKKGQLKTGIAFALQNIITTSESISQKHSIPIDKWIAPPGTWLLLSEVSLYVPKALSWRFLRHHWKLLDRAEQTNDMSQGTPYNTPVKQGTENNFQETEAMSIGWAIDRVFLLQTISNVAVVLIPDAAAELAHDLLIRVEAFNMHPREVDAHVKALITLCKRQASSEEEGNQIISAWVGQLLSKAEEILDAYVIQSSNSDNVNSFKTPQPLSKTRSRMKKKGNGVPSDFTCLSIQVVTAIFTIGALVLVCPTAKMGRLVTLLQAMVTSKASTVEGTKSIGASIFRKQVAPPVYTQAWVALGKICLADDKLAKSCIPLFLQELEITDSPAIRNNIMVAMSDFCVRYTALVDGCIPKLTKSLRDPCELVRRQTFILLARLLQRDYVKWKGVLFYRFLLALVDESEKIQRLADYLFGSILKTKAPLLAYNSFVETIFILNDCHAHAGHSETVQTSENDRRLFSLRGSNESVSSKRMHIYISLLKQMAPEHLLATSAKLCAEILAAAADGLLNLDDDAAQCVLQDALQILACKEMRIQANRLGGGAENMELEEESGAAAFAAAKGRVVTQIAKKNLIQNAIPIFIELKRLLESKNSSLIGCLMDCLRMILKEYKNEIDEILVADKQLQKELLYDIQKYESSKTKSQGASAVSSVQDSVPRNVQTEPNNSIQKSNNTASKLPHKASASVTACNGNVKGKENIDVHGGTVGRASAMKRKTFLSPGMEKSSAGRVKWLDQASGSSQGMP